MRILPKSWPNLASNPARAVGSSGFPADCITTRSASDGPPATRDGVGNAGCGALPLVHARPARLARRSNARARLTSHLAPACDRALRSSDPHELPIVARARESPFAVDLHDLLERRVIPLGDERAQAHDVHRLCGSDAVALVGVALAVRMGNAEQVPEFMRRGVLEKCPSFGLRTRFRPERPRVLFGVDVALLQRGLTVAGRTPAPAGVREEVDGGVRV